eukprot:1127565-Pleurochrysis_carterae.AAC.2
MREGVAACGHSTGRGEEGWRSFRLPASSTAGSKAASASCHGPLSVFSLSTLSIVELSRPKHRIFTCSFGTTRAPAQARKHRC